MRTWRWRVGRSRGYRRARRRGARAVRSARVRHEPPVRGEAQELGVQHQPAAARAVVREHDGAHLVESSAADRTTATGSGMAQHHQQRVASPPRQRETAEIHLALPAGRRLEAVSGLDRSARPDRADVVPEPAARTSSNSRCTDNRGNSASRASMIPLYGSSLYARCDRGEYRVPPAARSRSRSPDGIHLLLVRRLTPKHRDSSAFDTPRSRRCRSSILVSHPCIGLTLHPRWLRQQRGTWRRDRQSVRCAVASSQERENYGCQLRLVNQ